MQLDQVLRFDDSSFELFLYYGQVNDKKSSFSIEVPLTISFHSIIQWILTWYSLSFLKVTMAYSDTYASSYSTSVLVNDVDLTVTCGNTTFYPNEWEWWILFTFRLSEADHYNNVEVTSLSEEQLQAACKDPEQGKAIITVTSHSLSTKYQPVSIVITGDFKFESVTVTDDKTKDYKDVPSKIYNTEVIMMIVVAVIVVCAIVYCIM